MVAEPSSSPAAPADSEGAAADGTAAGGSAGGCATRVFLGWDAPLLTTAADALVERFGHELHEVVVALPGRRAGRRLEELLVDRGVTRPAEITTSGQLTDRLLQLDQTVAKRSARTLAWAKVLRGTADLSPLLAARPEDDDVASWLALAAEIRSLHAELVAEGMDFEAVVSALTNDGGTPGEIGRWQLLAQVQTAYRNELALHGLADAHDARWQALGDGALDATGNVVLVGVTEMSGLLRQTLQACAGRVTAFVCAPQDEHESFDDLGGLRSEAFLHRELPLDPAHWWVEDDPAGQAERVLSLLAVHGGEHSASEITIGLPDEQLEPVLVARLAGAGVAARAAQGARLSVGAVCQLLSALADHLRGRGFDSLAALLRHPDLEKFLAGGEAERLPAEWLDEWSAEHLPSRVPKRWSPLPDDERDRRRAQGLGALCEGLNTLLGELASAERRSLIAWAPDVRALLSTLYADRDLAALDRPAPDDPQDAERLLERRLVHRALELAGKTLAELESLPSSLGDGWSVAASDALRWVADEVSREFLPGASGEDAVELLGWLELPLDDAPLLIVTGFNDGVVPESISGHAYLPDGLRRRLGLPDNDHRLARDAAALTMMVHSRPTVHFIGGRRSLSGDPLLPSRLAFACDRAELPGRVQAAFPSAATAVAPQGAPAEVAAGAPGVVPKGAPAETAAGATADPSGHGAAPARIEPPCPAPSAPLEAMAVTAFGSYLRSPYTFYLEKRQRLRRAEDGQREMDGMIFGNVAHTVLERFGLSDVRDSDKVAVVEEELTKLLKRVVAERFGRAVQPAVAVQLQQLGQRLQRFARDQAGWAAQGWRVEKVEWAPPGGSVPLEVDGEVIALRGRIDRIDRNEHTGQLAILDYKTGETVDPPNRTHGPNKQGVWKDLQLPLYVLLAAEWKPEPETRLGYFALPQDSNRAGVLLADWSPGELAAAHLVAKEIVRRVRRNEVTELGTFSREDPVWTAIAGVGLVGGPVPKRFVMTMPGDDEGDAT